MVKSVVNGVTTYYPGRHYNKEVNGTTERTQKLYQAAGQTIAVRTNDELKWILSDHLGSASVTANADGTWNSELRYTPYGETRYNSGLTPSDYRYTGQLQQAELGLYYYVARWYDPALGRFISADTLIPGAGNPLAWDRYMYTLGNPLRMIDPSGHSACEGYRGDPECGEKPKGIKPDTKEREGDDLIPLFEYDLSPEEVDDLLSEINWLLDKLETANDLVALAEYVGVSVEFLTLVKLVSFEIGLPAGAALLIGGDTISNTVSDLEDLRYEIVTSSNRGAEGINISMGENVVSWNISINDDPVVKHLTVPYPLPILTPILNHKGTFNLTPIWMYGWAVFDCEQSPLYVGPGGPFHPLQ